MAEETKTAKIPEGVTVEPPKQEQRQCQAQEEEKEEQ